MRLGTPGLRIGIFPRMAFEERRPFLNIMGEALDLAFEARDSGDYASLAGLFVFSDSPAELQTCRASGLSLLRFDFSGPRQSIRTKTVKFSASDALHAGFRGQTLIDPSLTTFCPLETEQCILASIEGLPVWTREQFGEQSLHTIGIDLPVCVPNAVFYKFFRWESWFEVFPFLTFLKDCIPASCWQETEARASIIIDDPNLHRTKYGFIDFRNLVRHANQHNYHASIATIPLDMWYTDPAAAAIFRDNPQRLSLLLHGVNHTTNELAQKCSHEVALATLAEGLRRVERFEGKSGLSVARVVAPPHGAFAEHFAEAMTHLEYEGTCVSTGSMLSWNRQGHWPADTGLRVAQAVGNGSLPVFPRIGCSDTEIRLLSFLGNPIIVASHHQDCAMNFSQFEKVARIINSITETKWCSVGEIARSNYYAQPLGSTLLIFLYSRNALLNLPEGTSSLEFKTTPFCAKNIAISVEMLREKRGPLMVENVVLSWDEASNQVSVRVISPRVVSHRDVQLLPAPWLPFLRRVLTEARDRALPLAPSWIQGR